MDDHWGVKLSLFFRDGDPSKFSRMLTDDCSLVCFDGNYIPGQRKLSFEGPKEVATALIGLRSFLTEKGMKRPRRMDAASLAGPLYDQEMNKLSLRFSEGEPFETSCGWMTGTRAVDLFYKTSYSINDGEDSARLQRFAILPPMGDRSVTRVGL